MLSAGDITTGWCFRLILIGRDFKTLQYRGTVFSDTRFPSPSSRPKSFDLCFPTIRGHPLV